MATKTVAVHRPFCGSGKVSKNGRNKTDKQVYGCNNPECTRTCFVEEYTYKGNDPAVRKRVLKMAADCTGTRATSASLAFPSTPLRRF